MGCATGTPGIHHPPKKNGARPAPGLPPPGPLGFEWRGGELPRDVAPPYWLGRGDDIMFVAAVVEPGGGRFRSGAARLGHGTAGNGTGGLGTARHGTAMGWERGATA